MRPMSGCYCPPGWSAASCVRDPELQKLCLRARFARACLVAYGTGVNAFTARIDRLPRSVLSTTREASSAPSSIVPGVDRTGPHTYAGHNCPRFALVPRISARPASTDQVVPISRPLGCVPALAAVIRNARSGITLTFKLSFPPLRELTGMLPPRVVHCCPWIRTGCPLQPQLRQLPGAYWSRTTLHTKQMIPDRGLPQAAHCPICPWMALSTMVMSWTTTLPKSISLGYRRFRGYTHCPYYFCGGPRLWND